MASNISQDLPAQRLTGLGSVELAVWFKFRNASVFVIFQGLTHLQKLRVQIT
jgi:hypothetical protein